MDANPIENDEKGKSKLPQPEPLNGVNTGINCDQCPFVADAIPVFIAHLRAGHSVEKENCKYCDHVAHNNDELMDHMCDRHGEIVLMARRMDKISAKFGEFDTLRLNLATQ